MRIVVESLIALLLVVGLVGSCLFWPSSTASTNRVASARYNIGTGRLLTVETLLRSFHEQNGRFPDQLEDLVSTFLDSYLHENGTSKQQAITNPVTQAHFPYEQDSDSARVIFLGVDNAIGGEGFDEDIELVIRPKARDEND